MGALINCQISLLFVILIFVFFNSNQNVEAASDLPKELSEPFAEDLLKLLQDQAILAEAKLREILGEKEIHSASFENWQKDTKLDFNSNFNEITNLERKHELLIKRQQDQAILAEAKLREILGEKEIHSVLFENWQKDTKLDFNSNIQDITNLIGPDELFNKRQQDQIILAEAKRDEILYRHLTSRPNPYHNEIVEFELNQPSFQNSDATKVLKTNYEPFIYKLTQTVTDQKQDEILDHQLIGLSNSYLTEIDSFKIIIDKYDLSSEKAFSIPFEPNRENFHTTDDASDQQDSFVKITLHEKKIPQWIVSKINRWSNYYENDSEFFICVNYMVKHEIISFNDWPKSKSLLEKQVIPDWFMDIGDLWSDGKISDEEFISAIEYLLEERIIRISHS